MIRRCAELHMHQIAHGGDPFETGSARPLDFGHWAAHKLESLTQHHLRHGEAVAIGMALDARYSVLAGLLAPGRRSGSARCSSIWASGSGTRRSRAGAPTAASRSWTGLREFREHLGGELTVTLLAGIGRGVEVHEIDEAHAGAAIAWLEAAGSRRHEARRLPISGT